MAFLSMIITSSNIAWMLLALSNLDIVFGSPDGMIVKARISVMLLYLDHKILTVIRLYKQMKFCPWVVGYTLATAVYSFKSIDYCISGGLTSKLPNTSPAL